MLQGTLDVLNFADVLTIAHRKRVTGTLRVRTSQFNAMIHFSRGRVARIDSAGVPGRDLAVRAEEATALLLAAAHGTFELQPMEHSLAVSDGEGLDVRTILAGARDRLEELRDLQRVVLGADARPRLATTLDSRQVVLTAELWRVVQAIDGHRSARSLADQLGLSQQRARARSQGACRSGTRRRRRGPGRRAFDAHGVTAARGRAGGCSAHHRDPRGQRPAPGSGTRRGRRVAVGRLRAREMRRRCRSSCSSPGSSAPSGCWLWSSC